MSFSFPQDFRFGVADADLQVIGETHTKRLEKSEETMWTHFAKTSGRCFNNDTPEIGIDRYHKWQEDIEIMKKMGIGHYRTSVSIARLLKRNGDINKEALLWYKNYFTALNKAGVAIYATLYHWELPQFLSEQGGWKNRKTIDYLTKHATAVAQNLGEYITEFFIFNESRHASIRSYYEGIHAPGGTSLKDAFTASHIIHLTHVQVFKAITSIIKNAKIGTVVTLAPSYAHSGKEEDIQAARICDALKNRWFVEPFFLGEYPKEILEYYKKDMPTISSSETKGLRIGSNFHSLGINYYKGNIVVYDPYSKLGFKEKVKKKSITNDLGWPIFYPPLYPEGLYDILNQIYFAYKKFGLPQLYVTENGMALKSREGKHTRVINDAKRITYLQEHLRQIHKAILRGVPVKAYFAWTLMDNYEWAEGYKPESCFGLIHVDRKTLKRTWKESAYWYQKVIKTHSLAEE